MKPGVEPLPNTRMDFNEDKLVNSVTSKLPDQNANSNGVKAINSNTFVVKLKSCETNTVRTVPQTKPVDISQELSPIPSLLQLVQGNKNSIQIHSLGSHKIIINRPPSIKLHGNANNGKITIIKPSGNGNSIIRKFSNVPNKPQQNGLKKSALQSINSMNNVKSKLHEEKENSGLIKINKNIVLTTSGQKLNNSSKFTFNLALNSNLNQESSINPASKSTPIHVSIPNIRTISPLKSINTNLKPKDLEIKEEFLEDDGELTNLSWLSNGKNIIEGLPLGSPDSGLFSDDEDIDNNSISDAKTSPNHGVFTAKSKVLGSIAKAIYNWVCKHFPYFYGAPPGWKNSIRHNLSLNKCFKKADVEQGAKDPTKGSLWCIDPAYRPNLITALKRTPFYPYIHPSGIGQPLSLSNLANLLPGAQSGRIPLWSPTWNSNASTNYSNADPDVASAALNLLGLKAKDDESSTKNIRNTIKELQKEIVKSGCWPCPWKSPLVRTDSFSSVNSSDEDIVISTDSTEDHNYTGPFKYLVETHEPDICLSPDSDKSAPDAAYEFETGGTDDEEDLFDTPDDEDCDSVDSAEEMDLGDSGFGASKNSRKTPNVKRKRRISDEEVDENSTLIYENPMKSLRKRKAIKIKLGPKSKKNSSPNTQRSRKNKNNVTKIKEKEESSETDSGKDSPKVNKARSRVARSIKKEAGENEYKKTYPSSLIRHRTRGAYGTRSSSVARTSSRLAGKYSLESTKSNIRRRTASTSVNNGSNTTSTEDEEVKLAAGSLMHLAGISNSSEVVS